MKKMLQTIEKAWKKHPDLTFGQLITNAIDPKYLSEVKDEILIELIEKIYDT